MICERFSSKGEKAMTTDSSLDIRFADVKIMHSFDQHLHGLDHRRGELESLQPDTEEWRVSADAACICASDVVFAVLREGVLDAERLGQAVRSVRDVLTLFKDAAELSDGAELGQYCAQIQRRLDLLVNRRRSKQRFEIPAS
jgi:hypothetical protein